MQTALWACCSVARTLALHACYVFNSPQALCLPHLRILEVSASLNNIRKQQISRITKCSEHASWEQKQTNLQALSLSQRLLQRMQLKLPARSIGRSCKMRPVPSSAQLLLPHTLLSVPLSFHCSRHISCRCQPTMSAVGRPTFLLNNFHSVIYFGPLLNCAAG